MSGSSKGRPAPAGTCEARGGRFGLRAPAASIGGGARYRYEVNSLRDITHLAAPRSWAAAIFTIHGSLQAGHCQDWWSAVCRPCLSAVACGNRAIGSHHDIFITEILWTQRSLVRAIPIDSRRYERFSETVAGASPGTMIAPLLASGKILLHPGKAYLARLCGRIG
jgi:hypothetical protein